MSDSTVGTGDSGNFFFNMSRLCFKKLLWMQIENGLKGRVGRLGLGMSKCDVGWERWT